MITIEDIDNEANKANTSPTEKQREAGNYAKGHMSIKGMRIAIENPKGSKRYYADGKKYNVMKNHYGYFNITKGKDGDAVDVFLGPDVENFDRVYCIDQNKANGEFDETKVMLGFSSKEEAKEAYMSNYSPDWKGFRDITSVSIKDFKKWLYRGRRQRQPFADYVYIKKKKINEMKKVVRLDESGIRKIVAESLKKVLKEDVDTTEIIYDKAMRIIRGTYDFESDLQQIGDVVMKILDDPRVMNYLPDDINDCAKLVASKAIQMFDPEYYEMEFSQLYENRIMNAIDKTLNRYLNENKLTRDDDFSYPDRMDFEDLDYQYDEWKRQQEPTRADLDDAEFSMSSEEPDLVNDEIGAAYDRTHTKDGIPIDADDEGAGYSREYDEGVEYANNLIAKGRIPSGLVDELKEKEDSGDISAFEVGILDTLCEDEC